MSIKKVIKALQKPLLFIDCDDESFIITNLSENGKDRTFFIPFWKFMEVDKNKYPSDFAWEFAKNKAPDKICWNVSERAKLKIAEAIMANRVPNTGDSVRQCLSEVNDYFGK